jgi:hypothetical protein
MADEKDWDACGFGEAEKQCNTLANLFSKGGLFL